MAKLYDALKRVEEERSKQGGAAVAMPASLTATPSRPSVWATWFGRREPQAAAPPRPAAPDLVLLRLDTLSESIESLRKARPAPSAQPQVEALAEQIGRIETQVRAMEQQLTRNLTAAVDSLAQRTARLHTRVGWLLLAAMLAVVVALARL